MLSTIEEAEAGNWLAARGLASGDEIGSLKLKQVAKQYGKDSGKKLAVCFDEICQALGYDNFEHYQNLLKQKGEYVSKRSKTRVVSGAKWVSQTYSEGLAKHYAERHKETK